MNGVIQFSFHDEEERLNLERAYIQQIVFLYIEKIKEEFGDVFDHDIAFRLEKSLCPPFVEKASKEIYTLWCERIDLKPIKISRTKLELPKKYYPAPKYTIKERLKILFKGRI